jgi:AraC-like DNA-binding protein
VPENLDFTLFQPKGRLASMVQGVWSSSVATDSPNNIERWLQSDACSGFLFNLSEPIQLNDISISTGGVLLPVSKQAQLITLPPGAVVVGVRFHPAMSFAILGNIYQQATLIKKPVTHNLSLETLGDQLEQARGHFARIVLLYRWLDTMLQTTDIIPAPLVSALKALEGEKSPGELSSHVLLSQRQIERHFQKWLNMTPKYYQRISRVRNALKVLKLHPETALVDLALSIGFTDQAHMTREFKYIARITPKHYSQKVMDDKSNVLSIKTQKSAKH